METPKQVRELYYIGNCVSLGANFIENLLETGKKANGSRIKKLIKTHYPEFDSELMFDFYNPYESNSLKTEKYLVYVHSGIEYVFEYKI